MNDDSRGGSRDDNGGTEGGGTGGDDSSQDDGNERSRRTGNGGESEQKGTGGKSGRNDGGGSNGRAKPTTAEWVVIGISVLVTLSLITYGGWQMVTTPDETVPSATVVGTETLPNGGVAVTVELTNPGDVGLVSTTVAANCSTPPPSVELTYVPASSTRRATLVCPPGTTSPNVSVSNWVTA